MTDVLGTAARWRNWGRSATATPAHIARPTTVDEVVEVLRLAADRRLPVKAVGAGHSFTEIAATSGVQVDLSNLRGLVSADPASGRVRVRAGTYLWELPAILDPLGLALANMGDVDRQTIAGATSTGTHGTGLTFPGLAAQLTAVTLVTATGEVLEIDEAHHPELLPAARLGLGALGIVVEVEVQCVPAFLLRAVEHPMPFDEVLDDWTTLAHGADHFEFYWWPHTDVVMTKANTRLPLDTPHTPPGRLSNWVEERLIQNEALRLVLGIGKLLPAVTPSLSRLATQTYGDREFTARSYEVFTSPRLVRFREMEYAIPFEELPQALRDVRGLIDRRGWRISFPIEVRAAAPDGNWLSTAYERPSAYIAVHRWHRDDPTEYFQAVDALLRTYDGRPHWGKMHLQDAESLRARYPRFDDFLAVRERLDPDRRFANRYLDRVLGA